jgi:hypothetical protein
MANLTKEQLETLAKNAGFTGEDIKIAAAVALAESGGNPSAHNAKPPDDSYGLWQINMLGAMGPDRRKRFGITDNKQLFDPATNAKAAKIIFDQQGWQRGWTTYSRGTYKKFLTDDPSGETSAPPATSNPITGAVNALSDSLFKAASNIVGILVALVFLVLGVVLLGRNMIPTKKLLNVAKKAAK